MTVTIGYDRDSIRLLPDDRPSTYRIVRGDGSVVWAGASIQPRSRLLAHLRNDVPGDLVRVDFHRNPTAMARAEREMLADLDTELDCGPGGRHGAWRAQRRGW